MPRTIINVSNRLPVTVATDSAGAQGAALSAGNITKSSGGLVAALEGISEERYQLRWLGWPGTDMPNAQAREQLKEVLEGEFGCTPVFLEHDEAQAHYEGFSNSSLWPLLHYMPSVFRYQPEWWEPYRTVNQKFADAVLSIAGEDDIVWVHDYQLMLLPGLLKQARPTLRIGFFLHTPFPSYEVFRCHPNRSELVEGLLGADQIGFHTYGYARHFRSAILRLLGVESEIDRFRYQGRTIHLGIYPIGINARKFREELASEAFAEKYAEVRRCHQDRRIILSVERMDYTKGILHRLDAIDLFLSQHEERDNVKFVFISVPSRETVGKYRELREAVEAKVGRINGTYASISNSPIRFIHSSVSFTELCALYAAADVAMITPLMDGMNLVAKEFVACQVDDPGVLILSEFAGAAEELFNAILVNPYDARAVVAALEQALEMSPEEKAERMRGMRQRVMTYDAEAWARSFIEDLVSRPSNEDEPATIEPVRQRLRQAISRRQRVGLFLDYDGTLREFERNPSAARPNAALIELLSTLAHRQDPNLEVTIVSGRTPQDLEAFLGHYPFGLIAEHGATMRRPGQTEWEELDRTISYAWKDQVRKILELYEQATPGSFVEDKRTSLVWHYRKADPEFGTWKARQLMGELAGLTVATPVQVRHGKKIVEVTVPQVNKGAAVARLLDQRRYDLALIAGDDATDETMFQLDAPNLLTVKVGEGDTRAHYRVRNPAAFRQLLHEAIGEVRGG